MCFAYNFFRRVGKQMYWVVKCGLTLSNPTAESFVQNSKKMKFPQKEIYVIHLNTRECDNILHNKDY